MLRLALLAGVLSAALGARPLSEATTSTDSKFEFFLLVRQWPGSFCSENSCPYVHDHGYHFTVHGLWPNNNDGTWPQDCDPTYPFDEDEIEDLEDEMEAEWPTFRSDHGMNDESFWIHEWSKHGTCALNIFKDEHAFFKATLDLHEKYDLAAALRRANILPSEDTLYRKESLVDAVADMYGVRPLIHCLGKKLTEVWMCIGKDLKPFNCSPSHERGGCDEVLIPPFGGGVAEGVREVAGGEADQGEGEIVAVM